MIYIIQELKRYKLFSCCIIYKKRLRWFGHVERAPEDSWINKCRYLEVEGNAGRGRPRKTWQEVVNRDIKDLGVNKDLAQDRSAWKSAIICAVPPIPPWRLRRRRRRRLLTIFFLNNLCITYLGFSFRSSQLTKSIWFSLTKLWTTGLPPFESL